MVIQFCIEKISAWAPGLVKEETWVDWARCLIAIKREKTVPLLEFMSKVSTRRLSQLSKMVLHVGHELLETYHVSHMILCSQYGEIEQQNQMTRELLKTGEVRPSKFSLSVFNTPISLLSIQEGIKGSVDIILAGENCLATALQSVYAQLNHAQKQNIILIFSDELLPEDYVELIPSPSEPYAFALLISPLSANTKSVVYSIATECTSFATPAISPLEFLRWLLLPSMPLLHVPVGDSYNIEINRIR